MQLNIECVRAVLMYIENNNQCEINRHNQKSLRKIGLKELYGGVCDDDFTEDNVWYTVLKLFEGRLIDGWKIPSDAPSLMTTCEIESLTLNGHELLDNIRDPEVFKKTKSVLQKVASVSLNVFSQVAGSVSAEYTKHLLGITN
jgi:hypothetical protein